MSNGGGMFSPEEVAYLKTLPAVAEATARRITYSEAFKQSCMRRYHAGESPVKLFREAGLDPALIGYKRIERCFARWRKSSSDAMAGPQYDDRLDAASAHVLASMQTVTSDRSSSQSQAPLRAITFPAASRDGSVDVRDLMIYQQVRRIDELEQEVGTLRMRLDLQARTEVERAV
ncbi:hypothetical protein [Bifidobacterium dentium]|uniref:hypothetical protein n=1 Tax=Bifidobacterium dentium TaxID=1689 RepID=UPI0013BF63A3|nr:hypothetical protein [Bifidobacterium dentium]MBF9670127.1 hypothetical protein [Bifidobacterium dentium]NEG43107.1 hypothetical protein [Bifidobacterium dentium]NEG53887.1 hypothetical protein [Bifidobacterium dentium]